MTLFLIVSYLEYCMMWIFTHSSLLERDTIPLFLSCLKIMIAINNLFKVKNYHVLQAWKNPKRRSL